MHQDEGKESCERWPFPSPFDIPPAAAAAANKPRPPLLDVPHLAGVAVDSMRVISARQALHGSAAPGMNLRAPRPGSFRRANFGNAAAADGDGARPSLGPRDRKGSFAMRVSSGEFNSDYMAEEDGDIADSLEKPP